MDFFSSEAEQCAQEFRKLLNKEEYISKKEVDAFLEKHAEIFSLLPKYKEEPYYSVLLNISQEHMKYINEKNQIFVNQKLIEYKSYFDNLFREVDPNILLDENQRKAILIDEDYSLIVAGAGSGKTTTMAAKVKYLIEKKKVPKDRIILLAFTKKAAAELDVRINEDFKLGVPVLTFHKLGMNFMRTIYQDAPKALRIIRDYEKQELFSHWFEEKVFPNKPLLQDLTETFPTEFYLNDHYLEFPSYDAYYEDYVNRKIESLQGNFKEEIDKRTARRMRSQVTICGEFVKSRGEVRIANALYRNGIAYTYEENYPYKVDGRNYVPDFTIQDFEEKIYIEYFGLATQKRNGEVESLDKDYEREIFLKRETHRKNHTILIELFGKYEDESKNAMRELEESLRNHHIVFSPRTEEEVLRKILETSRRGQYASFMNLMISFISQWKENNYQEKDFSLLLQKIEDEKVKKQLRYAQKIYHFYQNSIHRNYQIDFQDMINYSSMRMDILKEKGKLNYDYIIIDEYQDISRQRYHFAKRISDLFDSKIVAVGDDWQSIYSFSGSDASLFTHFCELMGYAEIVTITKTYRNSQELIDIAGSFVGKDKEVLEKKLLSDKHLENPIEIHYYGETKEERNKGYASKIEVLIEILKKIESRQKKKVLLLGRYNDEKEDLVETGMFFEKGETENTLDCPLVKNLQIDFLTVHKSKGLGYDEVILLNALDDVKGFPSQIVDHPLIHLLKEETTTEIDYPEERRLFYVALTRTKNYVYILVPAREERKSCFIKEILTYDNVKEVL